MTPLTFTLLAFAASVAAGLLGSLLGLGGGIIVIPVLTLLMGVNIRYAIGASIVSVIATSSGAAAAYVRERMTNLRVATLLELGTTTGALTGAYLAGHVASAGSSSSSRWSWATLPSPCSASAESHRPTRPAFPRIGCPTGCGCTAATSTSRRPKKLRTA